MKGETMRPLLVPILLALITAGYAGCGGDDGDGPSKQEFVAKADAICASANKKEAALGAPGPGWMYREQFDDADFLARFNAVGRAALRQLKALTPPQENRKAVGAALDSIARMVRALDARTVAVRAGRQDKRAAHIRAYEQGYADLTSSAGPLGLTECQGLSV
jgi:hypothetical protein